MNLEVTIEKGWSEKAGSVASHFFEEDRHVIVLDSDYVSNAPLSDLINAIVHESLHGAIAEAFQSTSVEDAGINPADSYSKYDNIQDFIEFWRNPNEVWDPEGKNMIDRRETTNVWEKWKPRIERFVALLVAILMILALIA
ncbi:hypothetical protein AKJ57_05080 [candidate division MSBL1 archaeon SCGC-AAA259A05]|uniref:Uncharacterized protein n=1 Tax=candidate division MSBL1 archaeon SCGC-AAA259A05 TaxID=1698259 RepID=A0A133U622_9EURY|nr:hypothetical protein AKJ57_05080 [candidate division MSBL1 archaeon SCGC-AAA259A05]